MLSINNRLPPSRIGSMERPWAKCCLAQPVPLLKPRGACASLGILPLSECVQHVLPLPLVMRGWGKVQFISIAPSGLEATALPFTEGVLQDCLNTAVGFCGKAQREGACDIRYTQLKTSFLLCADFLLVLTFTITRCSICRTCAVRDIYRKSKTTFEVIAFSWPLGFQRAQPTENSLADRKPNLDLTE